MIKRKTDASIFRKIKHFCFDKDGVLTDVHLYWAHTSRLRAEFLRENYGLPSDAIEALLSGMGIDSKRGVIKAGGPVGYRPREVVIEGARKALNVLGKSVDAAEIAAAFKTIDVRQQSADDFKVKILPGASDFLSFLTTKGISASIYSSDRKENLERILKNLGLRHHFNALVGGGCVSRPKPDPEGFLKACRDVGADPNESVYVGDTLEDLRMAREGGAAAAIGVGTGLTRPEELRRETPYVVERLDELLGMVQR